ncbi:MAG: enoyl-CoA hydratase/isomerase family protein, partial [Chitinophagaceae bacterium]
MNYQNILVEVRDLVLVVTINRAEKLNALNKQTLDELAAVLVENAQNAEVRGVLITGAGEKAFVAGADFSEFSSFN